ncbi:hypothetical protein E4U03_07785 [Rothia nasimurium]|uniref:Uncharacterized protein n=1 Tax=Rothia nasimurium TaxID=85336 RepID=A0A4Y9F2U6_9MICC|nr:hypothetical protein [Rothia nasimurium]MBF0808508.1 hypothetical protein [Rothia nasimurium]TFU21902.1 hypothetical protein E4U03_07785 [Rothia nasimurium]
MPSSVWNIPENQRSSLGQAAIRKFRLLDSSMVTITVGASVYEDDEIISYSTSYGKTTGNAGFTVPTATIDLAGEHRIASNETVEIKTTITYAALGDAIRFRGIVGAQIITHNAHGQPVTRLMCTSISVWLAKSKFPALLDPTKTIADGLNRLRLAVPAGNSIKLSANFNAQDRFYIPTGLTFINPSDVWAALARNAVSVDHHRSGEIVFSPGYAHQSHANNPMWDRHIKITADHVTDGVQVEQPQAFIESGVSVTYRTGTGVKTHTENIYHRNNPRPDIREDIDISEDIVYHSGQWVYPTRMHMATKTGTFWAAASIEFDLLSFDAAEERLLNQLLAYNEGDFMVLDSSISRQFVGKKYILGFTETLAHNRWTMRFHLMEPVIAYGAPN